ncbi:hypothetical protein DUNSADRAFT_3297 [Dunaliella salina]|uniref:Tubulin epsilon and delta complex protein 1 domain-containing protein n=1 Tax=Dunaliella salina TaxID=3046 RepID=A0ABQ7GU80_DUNSA|nr:hypothetical protein DUNSADRAFT_3297 [Dunaliella salina]|eukprot:KAF5838172.1 hypothetical protein DUNSADRAFT_3297 [Dunaliella salina]
MVDQSPAKVAIHALCETLTAFGASPVDPEAVRQAKFNGPVAPQMWRALHDLVILCILNFEQEPNSSALAHQWQCIEEEQLPTDGEEGGIDGMAAEGTAMVLRYLTVWSCPPDLLARISPPKAAPSRPLLLALAWLVARCCLFQRALARTQLPLELLQLLPPYSQDTSAAPATLQAQATAAQHAKDHLSAISAMLFRTSPGLPPSITLYPPSPTFEPPSPTPLPTPANHLRHAYSPHVSPSGPTTPHAHTPAPLSPATNLPLSSTHPPTASVTSRPHSSACSSNSVSNSAACTPQGQPAFLLGGAHEAAQVQREWEAWVGVEGRAQQAMCLMGKLRAQLAALQSLDASRRKLGARVRSTQTSLSPFELHLATHPRLMEQYAQALAAGAQALERQQQLATAAQLFFKWCGSVQEEQAKADTAAGHTPRRALPEDQANNSAIALGTPATADPTTASTRSFLTSIDPEALAGLKALPSVATPAGAEAGAALLSRLASQLQAVLEESGPLLELAAAREIRGQRPSPYAVSAGLKGNTTAKQQQQQQQQPPITLSHFKALAERAVTLREAEQQPTQYQHPQHFQGTPPHSQQQVWQPHHSPPPASSQQSQPQQQHSFAQQPASFEASAAGEADHCVRAPCCWSPAADVGTPWALPPDVSDFLQQSLQHHRSCHNEQQHHSHHAHHHDHHHHHHSYPSQQQQQHSAFQWQHRSLLRGGSKQRTALALQKLGNAIQHLDGMPAQQQQHQHQQELQHQQQGHVPPSVHSVQAVYGSARGRARGRRGSTGLRGWTSGVDAEGEGGFAGAGAGEEEHPGVGDVARETERLMAMTLDVARALAKTRAAHKHVLHQCAQALPEGYSVGGL